MALQEYIRPELTFVLEDTQSRDELFGVFCRAIGELRPELEQQDLAKSLLEREAQSATSTPEGIAFPHALAQSIDETFVALAKIPGGLDFGRSDHPRSDLVFCMFGSSDRPWEHVRLLARLARLVHTAESRDRLRAAKDAADLYSRMIKEDQSHE